MSQSREFRVESRGGEAVAEPGRVRAVVVERPLVVSVDGAEYAIMRTPGDDRELAVGFLYSEGLIPGLDAVVLLSECSETPDSIVVRTAAGASASAQRNLVVNSSCGLCGRLDIAALVKSLRPVGTGQRVDSAVLRRVGEKVRGQQSLFAATGGTHAASLFGLAGELVVVREDVGRHNALDKVLGHALLRGLDAGKLCVYLSGRVSLEMVVKAGRAGLSVIAAVSAPTDAAIDAAERLGIALCGFVRGGEFTVYTHGERILGS